MTRRGRGEEPRPELPATAIIAAGGSVAAERIGQLHVHQPPPPPVSWPVLVGRIPPKASAFQERSALRSQVDSARAGSGSVVLTQVLSGGGGVGKSQLAASYAREALAGGTDLVVWADAGGSRTVLEAFARAARKVQATAEDTDEKAAAREFLEWAASTSRSWLVVLDDVADPAEMAGWWPRSPAGNGWVLATTRRRDAILSGSGRVLVDVGVYTPHEAHAYLTSRLADAGMARLLDAGAEPLAAELGYLPLALSHAAAYMIDQRVGCSAYRKKYLTGVSRLEDLMPTSADGDEYGRSVAATMLLALDAADRCDPVGLASPALRIAALLAALEPAGHPADLWATRSVTAYLTQQRAAAASPRPVPGAEVTAAQAEAAVLLLHRYGLVSFDEQGGPRAVRVHALTVRAAREAIPSGRTDAVEQAIVDAVLEIRREPDPDTLTMHTTWLPDRIGAALLERANRASSCLQAGRTAEAVTLYRQVAAGFQRLRGAGHPNTLTARNDLADAYWAAGLVTRALSTYERVAADYERFLGADSRLTLKARFSLGLCYRKAGQIAEALDICERGAADYERVLGDDHQDTLRARARLAVIYHQAGRTTEATGLLDRVAAAMERSLGPRHPETVDAIEVLRSWKRQSQTGQLPRDCPAGT